MEGEIGSYSGVGVRVPGGHGMRDDDRGLRFGRDEGLGQKTEWGYALRDESTVWRISEGTIELRSNS